MLCVAKLLPAGKMPKQSKKLALQWYYMTYHRTDHAEYVKSGKKLSAETFKSLTGYFQALFSQKKIDGMLEHAEIYRLRNRAKKQLASDLCKKRDACRTSYTQQELQEREQRNGSWSH